MEKKSKDTNKTNELSQTAKRVFVICSVLYILFMMSVQEPWEHRRISWLFGSRLRSYGWDDFILWTLILIVIFWGILWVRKWKKFWQEYDSLQIPLFSKY